MATIQEKFGQAAIDSFINFCRADIRSTVQLERNEFAHVADVNLRRHLAQTMYGARWIYKLGLSVLAQDDEAIAHVRTQVIDYGSICETLLTDCILDGIQKNCLTGAKFQTHDCRPPSKRNRINWSPATAAREIKKRNFWWLIEVSGEETIVTPHLKGELTQLRQLRNTVHITELATVNQRYYRTLAKTALTTVTNTNEATRAYKLANP